MKATNKAIIMLVTEDIDEDNINLMMNNEPSGAVVLFKGRVRGTDEDTKIKSLFYECYDKMAKNILQDIITNTLQLWNLQKIIVCHRLGSVAAGETAVIVAVASAHRREAFEACAHLVDELKGRVPIWKKQFTEEGSAWISEKGSPTGPGGGS